MNNEMIIAFLLAVASCGVIAAVTSYFWRKFQLGNWSLAEETVPPRPWLIYLITALVAVVGAFLLMRFGLPVFGSGANWLMISATFGACLGATLGALVGVWFGEKKWNI